MSSDSDAFGRTLIDFDPARPISSDFSTATEMAAAVVSGIVAEPVPWPAGLAPQPRLPADPPKASDPLPRCDVLVVTWTAAEARTLSVLFTPGVPLEQWYEYKSNVEAFIPKVTGKLAPFNDEQPGNARYYHSLGLYCPVELAGRSVLLLKSGLHMDYDGPALPILDFWKQVLMQTGAGLVITTGTGGAVGSNVLLGDVIIAQETIFDCTTKFKNESFRNERFEASMLVDNPAAKLTVSMLKPNADRVKEAHCSSHPDGLPTFYSRGSSIASPTIVTTDFFAFDNTTDTQGLQKLGNVCEMGDASLGLAISRLDAGARPKWAAIRNASDPQMDGSLPIATQRKDAGTIYKHYGSFTTAASVLATWSLICETSALASPTAATAATDTLASVPAMQIAAMQEQGQQHRRQVEPGHVLMQIAASSELVIKTIGAQDVPEGTVAALEARLTRIEAHTDAKLVTWRLMRFVDEAWRTHEYVLAQVVNDEAQSFRGSYLFAGADIVAQEKFSAKSVWE